MSQTDVLESVMEALRRSGRPLSARRLHRLCRDEWAGLEDAALEDVKRAIQKGVGAGLLDEVRPGVVRLSGEGPSDADSVHDSEGRNGSGHEASEDRDGRRRKRLSRQAKALAGFPAAPISLEETAAMSAQSSDRAQLSDALWKRIHRKAAEIVGVPLRATMDSPDDEDASLDGVLDSIDTLSDADLDGVENLEREDGDRSKESTSGSDRGAEWAYDEVEDRQSKPSSGNADPIHPLKGRVRSGGRPYREKRRRSIGVEGPERRRGMLIGFDGSDGTVASTQGLLRRFGEALSLERVGSELNGEKKRPGALRATLTGDNERRAHRGFRPLFYFDGQGCVGLTEWDFPPRYEALELRVNEAIAEQAELVRRALLQRAGELDEASFTQLVVLLLSRVGFDGFKQMTDEREGEITMSADRTKGLESGKVVIVARHTWEPVDEEDVRDLAQRISDLGFSSGVVLTIGTFTGEAVSLSAEPTEAAIRLVDGQGLAELLYENDLGVRCHRLPARYLDGLFFETLGE